MADERAEEHHLQHPAAEREVTVGEAFGELLGLDRLHLVQIDVVTGHRVEERLGDEPLQLGDPVGPRHRGRDPRARCSTSGPSGGVSRGCSGAGTGTVGPNARHGGAHPRPSG